jgi:prepilin-type processing-associated H-X9-DG protein
MEGFNYTFGGGPLNGKDPSKTMLGFLSGAGGKAVVYADGHVVWESDNP